MSEEDAVDLNAAFEAQGFLADLNHWRDEARRVYTIGFTFIGAINGLAMRVMAQLDREQLPPNRIAAFAFYAKALKSFQCAIRLCECGAVSEGRVLLRLSTEVVIVMAALLDDPDTFELLVGQESNNEDQLLRAVYEHLDDVGYPYPAGELEQRREEVKNAYGEPKGIKYLQLAEKVGLKELYVLAYKVPSMDAAHATLRASMQHMPGQGNNEEILFDFNPTEVGLDETMLLAGHIVLCLLERAVGKMGAEDCKDEVAANRSYWKFLCRTLLKATRQAGEPDRQGDEGGAWGDSLV